MIWQTVKNYWKRITAVTASVAAVLGVLWGASGYVFAVDDRMELWDEGVVVAQAADSKADQALKWQEMQMEREKAEARAERKKWRAIIKMCMDGTIKDKSVCAEAQAALR